MCMLLQPAACFERTDISIIGGIVGLMSCALKKQPTDPAAAG